MKLWHGIALAIALGIVVTGVVLLLNTNQGDGKTSSSDIETTIKATYTANQVIDIVKAKYPDCYQYSGGRIVNDSDSIISIKYNNDGTWRVEISCPRGFRHNDASLGTKVLYFHEDDGSLTKYNW